MSRGTERSLSPEDQLLINEVKAKYFRYLDTRQWGALRSIFTSEAVVEGLPDEWGSLDTAEKFVNMAQQRFGPGIISVHHGHMSEIVRADDETARGIWAMEDYVTWPRGDRTYRGVFVPDMWGFRGYGHYEDEFVRTGDGWKISHLRLTRLRVDPLVGEAPQDLPFAVRSSSESWLGEV